MQTAINLCDSYIERGVILNLIVSNDGGVAQYRQCGVLARFDYVELITELDINGATKSEHALEVLSQALLSRGWVKEVKVITLDMGELGRPSKLIREVLRHRLDPDAAHFMHLLEELERGYFVVMGPEGELHILKTTNGAVLGHVKIQLDNGRYIRTVVLDIVGPSLSDFPEDFEEKILEQLKCKHRAYVDDGVVMTVRVNHSDLEQSLRLLSV